MDHNVNRRRVLGTVGAAVAAGVVVEAMGAPAGKPAAKTTKIVAVCCSPRKGKTTAASLKVCLSAAAEVGPRVETELIELAGMDIPVFNPAGGSGDFSKLAGKLSDPKVGGIIIGTPVYFGNMTSLCKAFLEHCMVFRKKGFALADKVAGVLAVGGARNGGQEMTIQSVQTALLCQEMIIVGDGRPTAHFGATVWSGGQQNVTDDAFGMGTAKNLGRRVAEVAMLLKGNAK